MGRDFHESYVPVMIRAIRSPHLHTASVFLQVLANNLGEDSAPIVIDALAVQELQETALSIVAQLNLQEAAPRVEMLTQDAVEEIAAFADKVLSKLKKQ
jgi:hypothetical protein